MNLLTPKTVEEHVVAGLAAGPKKTTVLLAEIDPHIRITRQAFYWALRKLKKEEVIVVYKGNVSLNTAWIKAMGARTEEMHRTYLPDTQAPGVLNLAEGESVSYTFANTTHLDAFWGHSQNLLIAQTPASEPVYSYDPHYWFYIARAETEKKIVDDIAASGRQFLMTVGGTTPLDKAIKTDFSDDMRQYHMEQVLDEENRYVVVIGHYITEVKLAPGIAEKVSEIYATALKLDEGSRSALSTLLSEPARHKIKISRNARRARELKARLGKHFFVQK